MNLTLFKDISTLDESVKLAQKCTSVIWKLHQHLPRDNLTVYNDCLGLCICFSHLIPLNLNLWNLQSFFIKVCTTVVFTCRYFSCAQIFIATYIRAFTVLNFCVFLALGFPFGERGSSNAGVTAKMPRKTSPFLTIQPTASGTV